MHRIVLGPVWKDAGVDNWKGCGGFQPTSNLEVDSRRLKATADVIMRWPDVRVVASLKGAFSSFPSGQVPLNSNSTPAECCTGERKGESKVD
jgi:hypothetical protein